MDIEGTFNGPVKGFQHNINHELLIAELHVYGFSKDSLKILLNIIFLSVLGQNY